MLQRNRRAILAVSLALAAAPLFGQGSQIPTWMEGDSLDGGAYGLGNQDLFVPVYAFETLFPSITLSNHSLGYLGSNAAGGVWLADLPLPAGSRISLITCYFKDSDPAAQASVALRKFTYNTSSETPNFVEIDPTVDSIDAAGAGYHRVFENFDETVRYRPSLFTRQYYALRLSISPSFAVAFRGCNVTWNRQVSPAPASATFSDVPVGHPYHRFIEALVDSGITAGCGGGLYCVSAPITRGEMAVFLAAALGLHFPN